MHEAAWRDVQQWRKREVENYPSDSVDASKWWWQSSLLLLSGAGEGDQWFQAGTVEAMRISEAVGLSACLLHSAWERKEW